MSISLLNATPTFHNLLELAFRVNVKVRQVFLPEIFLTTPHNSKVEDSSDEE
jgi:hypothetical protein